MQTLYLHIGYHKTGTTSLQSILGQNREALRALGVCYPQTKGDGKREYFNKHLEFFIALTQAQKSGESLTDPVDRISAEIIASGAPVAVISEESFSGFERPLLDAMTRFRAHFNVKVIAVVRRQDKYLQSFYQQSIKDFGEQREFGAFLRESRWNRLFYDAAMDRWAERFGAENLHVFSYDLATQGQPVNRAIMDLILEGRQTAFANEQRQWNASLPALCYETLKYLNRAEMPKSERVALLGRLRKGINATRAAENPLFARGLATEYLTPAIAQTIADVFGASNARLAARFFGGVHPFPGLHAAPDASASFDTLGQFGPAFAPKDVVALLSHLLLADKPRKRDAT